MTQQTDSLSAALAAPKPKRSFAPSAGTVLAAIALAASAGVWLYQQQATEAMKREVGDQLARHAQQANAATAREAAANERLRTLERELAQVTARQAEAQSQQATLATLYDALTRSETQRVLADLEQTLSFASQQLQLAGNVTSALVGLETVQNKLAELDRPELIPVRQAVARDIDRLKTQPYLDVVGISAKLDSLVGTVDKLPLAVDGYHHAAAPSSKTDTRNWFERLGSELWGELRQLVRIREMDKPEAMLLTPEQAFFLRENVKLRLLDARTALLLRNEGAFRADLKAVDQYLAGYFDRDARETHNTQRTLAELSQQTLSMQLPSLAESLAAVRSARISTREVQQ